MKKYWLPFLVFIIILGFLGFQEDWAFFVVLFKKLCLISLAVIFATLLRKVLFWYIDFSSVVKNTLLPYDKLAVSLFLGLWYLAFLISFSLLF